MPLTASASLVFSFGPISTSSGIFGVVAQEDGSYLFGHSEGSDTFPFPNVGHWWKSINQGLTWTAVNDTRGTPGQTWQFPTNIHTNILCAATYDQSAQEIFIERTVNFGALWSTVFSAGSAPSPNGRSVVLRGLQSFNRTKAVAWGELDGDNTNAAHLIALSTNAGATWTPQATWDAGDKSDVCNALGIAEDSTLFAQYTKFGGINRTSNFARSDNGGSTWTVLSPPPGGVGTPPNFAWAITCFDKNNIALAGQVGSSPTSSSPGLWWSANAGVSLTRLSASDVINFPTGGFTTATWEIKRLTKDACIAAIDQQNGTAGSPWRISLDKGHTYPIEVTQEVPGAAVFQVPMGKIVVTRDGHILLPLWSSPTYDDATIELWRATITC